MNAAMATAKERQLAWLLDEVLGGRQAAAGVTAARAHRALSPWLAAALALFAVGVAVGVAMLRADDAQFAQQPAPVGNQEPPAPHECHGAADLANVPADVVRLHCFDFDDDACAKLARFQRLEWLDLSGMDVDDRGVSRQPAITDVGVRALAPLTKLRWLCLAQCHAMRGDGLQALAAIPRLEHLDLTYSGVETPAIERLPLLGNLRTLVLSSCMRFHGTALAAVARIPGLRRLELRACTTLAAKDVLSLVELKELRWLDLRDCQGRFRGQVEAGFDDFGPAGVQTRREEPPPQDGIGITDEVVTALSAMPLEALLLGGSESLTDAIGESLAKMTTLRVLDLSNLPKLHTPTLAKLPGSLEHLSLRDSSQLRATELPALRNLRSLDVSGLSLSATDLQQLLADRAIERLWLGAKIVNDMSVETLQPDAAEVLARSTSLRQLTLSPCAWVDAAALRRIASIAELEALDLSRSRPVDDNAIAALGSCRKLRQLKLTFCDRIAGATLAALTAVPLRELDLYGTKCDPARVRELAAKHWPGCTVTLPNGQRFRTP